VIHPCAEQFMDVKCSLGQKLPNGNLKPDIYGAIRKRPMQGCIVGSAFEIYIYMKDLFGFR